MLKELYNSIFKYKEQTEYEFILSDSSNDIPEKNFSSPDNTEVSKNLDENLEYLKVKYNLLINSDIKIKNFYIPIQNKKIASFLLYIDGMVDDDSINDFILKPLFLKNSIKMSETQKQESSSILKKTTKLNLENFLYSSLIPQNSVLKENKMEEIVLKVNSGFCALFVENLNVALCIETKGFKGRSVDKPVTESIVKGSHEGFVENLRTNTSMLRKIINNENLVIEETTVGKISKTKVAICYMKNITNDDLVAEAKYRVNNLKIDYLLSSGQLEQFIKDNITSSFPQTLSTERSDRTANYILLGRVAILVNGSPFSIILPAILIDFLTSPEDSNLNYNYANFLRILRFFALRMCFVNTRNLYRSCYVSL